MNTVLDAILRLLRSEGLLTKEESEWFSQTFDIDSENNVCILPTDGGGNACIFKVLELINGMRLVIRYAQLFPDDPPINLMDVIYWIRTTKRMELRLSWIMPVVKVEAAPFWSSANRWSIPVRHPASRNKGLNTESYTDAEAFLFYTEATAIAAWNGHADPKPDHVNQRTVRRLRTGIHVLPGHLNWHGPPLLNVGSLSKALDAANPCR